MKLPTKTFIATLEILAQDSKTQDGIINVCLKEAADRLREFDTRLEDCQQLNKDTFKIFYGQQ